MAKRSTKKQEPITDESAHDQSAVENTPPATLQENQNAESPTQQPYQPQGWTIALSVAKDGPKMRLLRSNRFQQMQIHFDEKPADQYLEQLRQAGWKWRDEEQVWSKQLEKDTRWRVHAEAEKIFKSIADAIRIDNGLEPTMQIGQ